MTQQLACTYAALLLSDSGRCDADSILAVTKAAGIDVSSGMAHAFASALSTVDVGNVLGNIAFAAGSGAAAAPTAAPAAAAAAAPAADAGKAKKEEPEEEDDDMGFGLFD